MRLPCEAMSRAIYAFYQTYLCFLPKIFLLTVKCQHDYYQIYFITRKTLHSSIFYSQKIHECRVIGLTNKEVVAKVCYLILVIMY